jgi:hypothetical protein
MREESQSPRNNRELAARNQFFTPRYVVEFLTNNTLRRPERTHGMLAELARLSPPTQSPGSSPGCLLSPLWEASATPQ